MQNGIDSGNLEQCSCPYCHAVKRSLWAEERGFSAVRCDECGIIYLNPRPTAASRHRSTQMGVHEAADDMDIAERYVPAKVARYRAILQQCLPDVWQSGRPITWLDIGAGYGEFVEAVDSLAPAGSKVRGLEPMVVKAEAAQKRGLDVMASFIGPNTPRSQFVSLINVFSHINDFDEFLRSVTGILEEGGEIFIETGDIGDLRVREDFPGELGLPDHVVFAGARHLSGFLERNGFKTVSVHRVAIDGYVYTAKNLVKWALGRKVILRWPNSSPYRSMRVRARKLPLAGS